MTLTRDLQRRIAIVELVSRPDQEPVTRAHTWTMEGDPHRYELIPELAQIYIQQSKVNRNESRGSDA